MSEKIGAAPTGHPDDSAARRTHWRGAARPNDQGEKHTNCLSHTDRELLELAAKAAGHRVRWHEDSYYGPTMEVMEDESGGPPWNPLTDDGDALRLAAVLRLHILHNDPGEPVLWVSAVLNKRGIHGVVEFQDEEQRDAATRRAIVRAAAKIGTAAKGGEA